MIRFAHIREEVVRPIMVVPPHAPDARRQCTEPWCAAANPLRHSFSDASLGALKYAISLAEETDAELTLFHSIEVPRELRESIPVPADFNIEQSMPRPKPRVSSGSESSCPRRCVTTVK